MKQINVQRSDRDSIRYMFYNDPAPIYTNIHPPPITQGLFCLFPPPRCMAAVSYTQTPFLMSAPHRSVWVVGRKWLYPLPTSKRTAKTVKSP